MRPPNCRTNHHTPSLKTGIDVVKPAAIYMNTANITKGSSKVPSPQKSIPPPTKPRPGSDSVVKAPVPLPPGASAPAASSRLSSATFSPEGSDSIYEDFDEAAEQFDDLSTRLDVSFFHFV